MNQEVKTSLSTLTGIIVNVAVAASLFGYVKATVDHYGASIQDMKEKQEASKQRQELLSARMYAVEYSAKQIDEVKQELKDLTKEVKNLVLKLSN